MPFIIPRKNKWDVSFDSGGLLARKDYIWTPYLTTTKAWYDASDTSSSNITHSNGKVSGWKDKSGNGNNLTQGSSAEQPVTNTRTINGLNVLDFDGTDDNMDMTTGISMAGEFGIFVVAQSDVGQGNIDMYLGQAANDNKIGIFSGTTSFLRVNNNFGDSSSLTFSPNTNAFMSGVIRNASDKVDMGYNGATYTRMFSDQTRAGNSNWDKVGGGQTGGQDWNGVIGEIIFIDGSVSTSLKEKIQGYFAYKWGFVSNLPSGHTYKNSPPLR